jgi:multisite-specific tRNA:(cytosine-C5)-methyltransferase
MQMGHSIAAAFELVDVSSELGELKRRPGLTSWRPTVDRSCVRTFESFEEFMASSLDDHMKTKLTEGHFPPKDVGPLRLNRWYVA